MFSVHTTPEEFENIITGQFGFVFEENLGEEITSSSLRFQNVFRPHENEKPALWNSSGSKGVFGKLRFRDGLVWTVGLTKGIKLCFQISPA